MYSLWGSVPRRNKHAYVVTTHSMLIAIYHIRKYEVVFKNFGADYHIQFNMESKINYI